MLSVPSKCLCASLLLPKFCLFVGSPVEHPQPPVSFLLLPAQVTLSYGVFEGKLNVIKLHGPFSPEEDPSRWVWGLKL